MISVHSGTLKDLDVSKMGLESESRVTCNMLKGPAMKTRWLDRILYQIYNCICEMLKGVIGLHRP